MTRMLLAGLLIVAPAAAAAQAPPVPPPPPAPPAVPAPPVVQVPPLPALAPLPPLPPDWIDSRSLEAAVREAQAHALAIDRETTDRLRAEMDLLAWQIGDLQGRGIAAPQLASGSLSGSSYNAGLTALNRREYEQAIARFDQTIARKAEHVDGALYWKAFAQFRLGRTEDALATIGELRRSHAQSRYLTDARVLEADVRRLAGQPVRPENIDDDEIKLLAIQGIQRSEPARAIAALEGVLTASNSLAVKRRALYVLALIDQPRAYEILLGYAKGSGNPDLQKEAIGYLGTRSRPSTSADLREIYLATQDTDIRRRIIDVLRSNGGWSGLTIVAPEPHAGLQVYTPTPPRGAAPNPATAQDLWMLYQRETNRDLKIQIVRALGTLQALDQLAQAVKIEKDAAVRQQAIRSLGALKSDRTGQMLVDLYGAEQDRDVRKAVVAALGSQGNAEALVAIARKEASLDVKTEIVRQLSNLAPKSKVAADYLLEIIK